MIFYMTSGVVWAHSNTSDISNKLLIGDYVYFGMFNQDLILWRVVSFDQKRNPILYADEILCYKAFDSADSGIYNGDIYNNNNLSATDIWNALGSSRWHHSTLRSWLNSKEEEVDYMLAPPSGEALSKSKYAYDDEAGFLSHFDKEDYSALIEINHKTLLVNNAEVSESIAGGIRHNDMEITYGTLDYGHYDEIRYEQVKDRVFLLSSKEFTNWIVKKNWHDVAKQAASISRTNPHKKEYALWLRTVSGRPDNPMCVYSDEQEVKYGLYHDFTASEADFGVRPAICLDKRMISLPLGKGTQNLPYYVEIKSLPVLEEIPKTQSSVMTREQFCKQVIDLYQRLNQGETVPVAYNPFIDTANEGVLKSFGLGFVEDLGSGNDLGEYFYPDKGITTHEMKEMLDKLMVLIYKDQTVDGGYSSVLNTRMYLTYEETIELMKQVCDTLGSQIGDVF